MHWMHHAILLSAVALIAAAGCGNEPTTLTRGELEKIAITQQKIDIIEAKGGLTLVIGGQTITSEEIIRWPVEPGENAVSALKALKPYAQANDYDRFAELARGQLEETLIRRITSVLIYQLVKNKRGDTLDDSLDKAAESELRQFIMKYGGDDAKADEALREMGIDRERFKELRKRLVLVTDYIGAQIPDDIPITYNQMLDKYDEIKDEFYPIDPNLQFSLIDIRPDILKFKDPNLADPEARALEIAGELIRRLNTGEDFAKLAQEYSHGPRKVFGGQWMPLSDTASLRAPYDILAEHAQKTEPGKIAGPITTLGHVFVMKLNSHNYGGYVPFARVQEEVRAVIIADKRVEVTNDIVKQLRGQAKLGVENSFVDFCLKRIHDLSKAEMHGPEGSATADPNTN